MRAQPCSVHGPAFAAEACPECLRELRADNATLRDTLHQVLLDAMRRRVLPEWWPMLDATLEPEPPRWADGPT